MHRRRSCLVFEEAVHVIRGDIDELCELVLTGNGCVILMDVVANDVNVGVVGAVLCSLAGCSVEREQTPKSRHHKAKIVLEYITGLFLQLLQNFNCLVNVGARQAGRLVGKACVGEPVWNVVAREHDPILFGSRRVKLTVKLIILQIFGV